MKLIIDAQILEQLVMIIKKAVHPKTMLSSEDVDGLVNQVNANVKLFEEQTQEAPPIAPPPPAPEVPKEVPSIAAMDNMEVAPREFPAEELLAETN